MAENPTENPTRDAALPGQVVWLTSASDPRVADYTQLTDVHLRKVLEPAEGLYIAESSRVLRRALEAGHRPRSFFLAEKWLESLADVLAEYPDVPAYVGPPELLEEITGFHLHRGAMAAMHRPVPVPVAELLAGLQGRARSRIAVLEDIVDHTNVGAIFRSAAAIGVDAVLVTPRCADPLYRRSIRVSMGAVFQVPWTRIESWPGDISLLKDAGYVVAGMSLGAGAITLDDLVAQDHPHLALVFGTENDGLTPETDRLLDTRVTIPMMNGVDSLNVAASSAVAFYATR